MAVSFFDGGKLAGFALLGGLLAVAGCQSGGPASALSLPGTGGGAQQQPAADDRITVQELTGYCPAITMRASDAIHDSYARGGQPDPSRLVYRASLTDSTRSCTYEGGMMNITVALAGRVVPGPAASLGTVRLPLRIAMFRDTEEVVSRTYTHEVALADTIGATQFIFTDTISIPMPGTRNIRVLTGYDNRTAR